MTPLFLAAWLVSTHPVQLDAKDISTFCQVLWTYGTDREHGMNALHQPIPMTHDQWMTKCVLLSARAGS